MPSSSFRRAWPHCTSWLASGFVTLTPALSFVMLSVVASAASTSYGMNPSGKLSHRHQHRGEHARSSYPCWWRSSRI